MKSLKVIWAVLLMVLVPVTPVIAKNLAGSVIVAVGDVSAVDLQTQQARKLKRRSKVYEGEEIRTGTASKVQLKFKDKGVIAIRQQSSLQITEYEYTGRPGAAQKSFFKLVKGGFRAISGAIGKQNPDDYRVDTPLATIGIRGTMYDAMLSRRLGVQVHKGAVNLSNAAGSITIGDGFDFRNAVVTSVTALPLGSFNPIGTDDVQPAEPDEEPQERDNQNENRTEGQGQNTDADTLDDGKTLAALDSTRLELAGDNHKPKKDNEDPDKADVGSQRKDVATIEEKLKDPQVASNVGAGSYEEILADTSILDTTRITGAGGDGGSTDTGGTDTGGGSGGIVDDRISNTELAGLDGHWGIASTAKEPVSINPSDGYVGGVAREEGAVVTAIIVDKGTDPSDPDYANIPIDSLLRQGSHVNDQTKYARFDTSVDTSISALSWGRWTGGNATLHTDAADNTVFTPVSDDIYWFMGSPADTATMPSTGEVRLDQTFLLAGTGSSGDIVDADAASISIGFTLDWAAMTFSDGEVKVVNEDSTDSTMNRAWKFFGLTGTLQTSDASPSPVLQFSTMPTGELCIGDCSVSLTAEGEIRAFILEGNNQLAGNFTFWEQGNTTNWVTGVFAVGEEARYTQTESTSLDQAFFGAFQHHPLDSGSATLSPIMGGKSETPTSGDFLMVDQYEADYGAVIRLGSGVVETTHAGGTATLNGHVIEWGAWNGSSVATHFASGPVFSTEKYSWITFSPIDVSVIDSLATEISFNLPHSFYGWQWDSGVGNNVPLEIESGYINVDFLADTISGELIFYGTGRFDVSFSGSTFGDGIIVESSSAYYNGLPVSIDMDGKYLGTTYAEGLAGAFKIGDPGDLNFYASGVFGFGRDERIDATTAADLKQVGFVRFDRLGGLGPEIVAGLATTPSSGIMTFRNAGASDSFVLTPAMSTPFFSSAMLGSTQVDWGAWDDPTGSANLQDDPIDTASVSTLTDAVAWVVGNPSDPTDIPTTGITSYNNIVGFLGYQSGGIPLNTPTTGDMTMSVNFAAQTFTSTMNLYASVDNWSMSYSGSLDGTKLSGMGSGTFNGSPASGALDAVFVGTGATTGGSGPEGLMGAFRNELDADSTVHSSGIFVLGQ